MKISSATNQASSKRNKIVALAAALVVATGGYALVVSRASGFFASVNPAQGTITGNASVVNDTDGSKVVQFNAPTTTPPPTAPPTSGAWPSASNSGLQTTTTKTMGGAGIDDVAWFKSNGFPGTGTAADPFLVDRVLFTSNVTLGNWDSSNLTGKWVKFTNCRFYGNGGNPTPGGSAALFARDNAPFFIVEKSTLGPNAPILASGGTAYGTNFGIFSYVPFQVRGSNIFGANILVGFETGRNDTTGVLVENNYIHDVWSSSGDHTDIINGNFHASHVVVRNNYLDGIRTGNSYVTNAFGIYDDPAGASGIFENWTIDHNYIDRAATLILATTNKSRFLDPFVLTNNTFARYSLLTVSARTPSVQKGNVDQNGKALSF
ncbi:MAG: hypothetical protein ABWX94_01530 [Candidatus Saccharimonadales bacterium]